MSNYKRAKHDWYVEPDFAVHALKDNLRLSGEIYDPFCGRGTIPRIFADDGYDVKGSDIVDRGYGERYDFLSDKASPFCEWKFNAHTDNIVSNPPYDKTNIQQIIRKCLGTARKKICLLLPIAFLSSQGRYHLFTHTPLSMILVLSGRPSMPPGMTYELELAADPNYIAFGGQRDYCWMIWDNEDLVEYPSIMWSDPSKYSVKAAKSAQ